ncbi:hypothetical protein HPB47_023779, partial [Ixodes persulcatus]
AAFSGVDNVCDAPPTSAGSPPLPRIPSERRVESFGNKAWPPTKAGPMACTFGVCLRPCGSRARSPQWRKPPRWPRCKAPAYEFLSGGFEFRP